MSLIRIVQAFKDEFLIKFIQISKNVHLHFLFGKISIQKGIFCHLRSFDGFGDGGQQAGK